MIEIHYKQAWIKLRGLYGSNGHYRGVVREIPLIKLRRLINAKFKLNGERVKAKILNSSKRKNYVSGVVDIGIES